MRGHQLIAHQRSTVLRHERLENTDGWLKPQPTNFRRFAGISLSDEGSVTPSVSKTQRFTRLSRTHYYACWRAAVCPMIVRPDWNANRVSAVVGLARAAKDASHLARRAKLAGRQWVDGH